jgi:hypothetical protein
MGKNKKELNCFEASKGQTNTSKSDEISNDERHNRNARESAIEQNYPRINTENL